MKSAVLPMPRPPELPSCRSAQDPDPQVVEKARRRSFPASYKLRILAEIDRCTEPGQVGVILRREGLYSSHLSKWRQQREAGLTPKKRGRKARAVDPQAELVARLEREVARLTDRLEKAETIIAVQKKLSLLLGTPQREAC